MWPQNTFLYLNYETMILEHSYLILQSKQKSLLLPIENKKDAKISRVVLRGSMALSNKGGNNGAVLSKVCAFTFPFFF